MLHFVIGGVSRQHRQEQVLKEEPTELDPFDHVQRGAMESMRTGRSHFLVFCILGLLAILLYGHTLEAPFYLDDVINIRDNLRTINAFSADELIQSAFGSYARYRPLANLSFALNYYFHGLQPSGYHAVNMVIHMLNGILLYLLIFKTITLPSLDDQCRHPIVVAALGSLLWSANPVQTEAVTYVVQRMTSMAALFFLCSFLFYLYGRLHPKKGIRVGLFVCSALAWVLSMASKQIALTLPVLLFLYEWLFFQGMNRDWLKRYAIYLAAVLAVALAAVYLIYGYSPTRFVSSISQPRPYTAMERFLTQGRVIFLYLGLLVYPHPARLNLNHDIPVSHGLFDPVTTLLCFVGLAVLFLVALFLLKKDRLTGFCLFWFLANVAIEALAANIEIVFEHRCYLPSMLFFLPFVWLISRSITRSKTAFCALAAIVIVFGYWTYQRNALWKNPVAFAEDGARKSPDHYRVHANLGLAYLNAKAHDKSLAAFKRALALNPPYPTEIHMNIGVLYLEKEHYGLAGQHLKKALALNPENFMALNHLGTLSLRQGDHVLALKHYQQAIKMSPGHAPSHYNIGIFYMETQDFPSAARAFERAINLRPMWSQAHSALGLAMARQSCYDVAVGAFVRARQLDPYNQEALFNLANTYRLTGQHERAAVTYQMLLGINPIDIEALHNLGVLYLKHLNNADLAARYLSKALSEDPNYGQAGVARKILKRLAKPSPSIEAGPAQGGITSRP